MLKFIQPSAAYKEMEEHNEAILVYEKAIELNPQYYEAYNNLGLY